MMRFSSNNLKFVKIIETTNNGDDDPEDNAQEKKEFICCLRMSQLTRPVRRLYWSQNLLKLNIQRQRSPKYA